MSLTASRASCTSPSCVYVSAEPFSWHVFAGIPRYTARLALALAAHVPIRFFVGSEELLTPESLGWSQDQDLEEWGRAIARANRRPLGIPASDCIGLYCLARRARRIFPYEVNIVHDFCATLLPWAFPPDLLDIFVPFLTEHILRSELVLADSHATAGDALWFSPLEPGQTVVAHPGPSLCIEDHCYREPVARSDRIGLVVSTIEPRKNAGFLFEWFHNTRQLPPDMELWWVGKLGWAISPSELERMAHPDGGRRVRFLDNVSDAELCRLYQMAGWTIYPSKYEGFGFPILDSLRHGTPVLASGTSSMREFDHPGVFFFDPNDPATVDLAWRRLQETKEPVIPSARLDQIYCWDAVARAILDSYARGNSTRAGGGSPQSIAADCVDRDPPVPVRLGPEPVAPVSPGRPGTREPMRVGIGLFMTETAAHNRGLGRYIRSLVSSLLARDRDNNYVLYCPDGLTSDQLPTAPNAKIRLLRADVAQGEVNLVQALARLVRVNPDSADVFLLLNAPMLAAANSLPFKRANGLKLAALICDLLPLLRGQSSAAEPEAERLRRDLENLSRLASYDALLVTSETSRETLLRLLSAPLERIVTIGTATDHQFFTPDLRGMMPAEQQALFQKLGIVGPFVLSVGSMEYQRRDHLQGLIEAFARLPAELRDAHQLVLAYDQRLHARTHAEQFAAEHGLAGRLILTDRLAARSLRLLYQRCAAFVSLTSHEEVGLPVLEAMHCGAPVIVGDSAAQLEVAGDALAVFNVSDVGALTGHLMKVLSEPNRARQLSEQAILQASRFHMGEVAGRLLNVLERLHTIERTSGLAPASEAPLRSALPAIAQPPSVAIGRLAPQLRPLVPDMTKSTRAKRFGPRFRGAG